MNERRDMLLGAIGFGALSVIPRGTDACAHAEILPNGPYVVMCPPGVGPDEAEYGKSWLRTEYCLQCGALFLPQEWRRRKL